MPKNNWSPERTDKSLIEGLKGCIGTFDGEKLIRYDEAITLTKTTLSDILVELDGLKKYSVMVPFSIDTIDFDDAIEIIQRRIGGVG